jgi:hypothetical protein
MEQALNTFKVDEEIFERVGDLEWFEGALISLFMEKNSGTLYLLHWVDVHNGFNRWLLYSVSYRALQLYMQGKLTNEDLIWLNNPAIVRIVDMNADMIVDKSEPRKVVELAKEYLPTAESYFDAALCLNLSKINQFLAKYAALEKLHSYPHLSENPLQVADSTNTSIYGKEVLKLENVESIGQFYAETLRNKLGINTLGELLKLGATSKDREEIAAKTGISVANLLRWVNMADMLRLDIGKEFFGLLEKAGVDSLNEMRTSDGANLHNKLVEINTQTSQAGRAPRLDEVEKWISQAAQLEPLVY